MGVKLQLYQDYADYIRLYSLWDFSRCVPVTLNDAWT